MSDVEKRPDAGNDIEKRPEAGDDIEKRSEAGDEVWQRQEVESPCIKICVIHPEARLCTGCLRSIDEITAWSRMAPEARSEVMAALPTRAAQLAKRRGGRTARLKRAPKL